MPQYSVKTYPVRWSSQIEASALSSCHIGIAPLIDDPWTRGKCGFKILQYMAAGLPVIGSHVGVHPQIICHEVTGFLVEDEPQWIQAIDRLAADASLRQQMGQAGRSHLIENYSVGKTARRMIEMLNMGLVM